jgi:hypothetical protein
VPLEDLLFWMWSRPPIGNGGATRYFAEDFPGAREKAVRWHAELPPVEVIPPLIVPGHRAPVGGDGALVNFGGLNTWMIPPDRLRAYAQAMTVCVAEALAGWPGPVTVAAGSSVLDQLRPAGASVRLASLPHHDYLRTLERSRLLVTSPGLHALYEAFARGVPCLLLPPQNLSQALTLRTFRKLGVASFLDWEDLYGPMELSAQDEQASCDRIAGCFERFAADPPARARLVAQLQDQLAEERLRAAVEAQDGFFAAFGGRDGADRVVAEILQFMD